ncbi:MAG: cation diffusion facilitator family transporter [Methylotenera sp.]|nr:cation diffusion facilitator family transporter [Methylotenera sp.]MDP1754699.1 cation diffusion facilitator family transporter [Methylotenera sp.]MDP1958737.1 cation diffusion facilitator family transporter [Methylotenera sp.]MDP3207206.1 cation diffusion facilitator family transporter [Methylotenera sp.]MDP3303649.1 cation diffusion facilitator family transporter [Methylotenera sp.]
MSNQEHVGISYDDPQRHALANKSTWVSVVVNIVLTFLQIVVGFFAHSQSLIADGLHSLSDLVCDFLVLIASHHSKNPADEGHPYGHGRVETAASFALGAILVLTGGAIMAAAAMKLQNIEQLPPVAPLALWVALIALVAKEGLFRYMLRVGERLRSPMLIANAWHARSDAASSLVVAVGIGANLMGFIYADAVAAIVVGFMIVRMGIVFTWDAFQELIDAGLSIEEVDSIRQTLIDTSGVVSLHELRTRRMAHRALVDAHILVDPRISVSEGHSIAERARGRVLNSHPAVSEVLVHVDPEDDLEHDSNALKMPGRESLLMHLAPLLNGLPASERVIFHYIAGKVEAEVYLPHEFFEHGMVLAGAEAKIAERLVGHLYFSSVSLNCVVMPKSMQ